MEDTKLTDEYIRQAREYIEKSDWYNLACLESIAGKMESAFEYLDQAAQQNDFDRAWAWLDPDFEWLRMHARFEQIVGPQQK